MISADELRARANRVPFIPFRIRTSDGKQFDISNPGLIMVGQRSATIGVLGPDDPVVAEPIDWVLLTNVDSILDLPPQDSSAPAGAATTAAV